MKSSQVLRFAGDVTIDKVKIITAKGFYQDVGAQVINVQFYEDLLIIASAICAGASLYFSNCILYVARPCVAERKSVA